MSAMACATAASSPTRTGPSRYGASLAARMRDVPGWWRALTEFAAARHHPGGAVAILRCAGRVLLADRLGRPPADHRQRRPRPTEP